MSGPHDAGDYALPAGLGAPQSAQWEPDHDVPGIPARAALSVRHKSREEAEGDCGARTVVLPNRRSSQSWSRHRSCHFSRRKECRDDVDTKEKLGRLRVPSDDRPLWDRLGAMLMSEVDHMHRAIELSLEMMRSGRGGPFGALIVKDGAIIAEGFNQVTSTNDPTAHAEMVAIRLACQALGTFDLTGCEVYTSCEPCPMCLGAIYWARLERIYYANDRRDAARIGFRDDYLYHETCLPLDQRAIPMVRLLQVEGWAAFDERDRKPGKVAY
jgi:guanine deaminase